MAPTNHKATAIYPGSFDPITLGHIDIIHRLAGLFSELVIVVANSSSKSSIFSAQERCLMVQESLTDVPNVRAVAFDGLTVDYARKIGASIIIRGLRAVADFEYEFAMANMNRKLAPDIETMIVFTSPEYSFISSRMVKEVASVGGLVSGLVPAVVEKALIQKLKSTRGTK